jgi:hypothetical protein
MTRFVLEHRILICLALSATGGATGVSRWRFPGQEPVLGVIREARPAVYAVLLYGYISLWFSSTFLVAYIGTALLTIFATPPDEKEAEQALPPYPDPWARQDLCLVVGERHHRTTPTPASQPQWLTISERGLYTGLIIVGAIGTGKTSACLYLCLEQLLACRAGDPARRVGGLVLEVKADFCAHVRAILARHGRDDDYVEISLTSVYRYSRLHNDLDAFALAYGIAMLMTHLNRSWEGALLVAGERQPGQVRDPAAPGSRGLRDAFLGVRARHQSGQAAEPQRPDQLLRPRRRGDL